MLPSSNTIARIVFAIATLALLLLSFTLYRQVSSLLKVQEDISETHLVRLKLEQTMSTLQDAEIAQRGFLLTRD